MPYRHIRSFVRRGGRITPRQQYALDTFSDRYVINLNEQNKLAFQGPVILEIGFGMGDALIAMAQAYPDVYFLGVEIYQPGIGALLSKLNDAQIQNVRVIVGDVVEVLTQFAPNDFFERVCIFFPDPWPKKRHHKRRLIQASFIALLKAKIKVNGQLHMSTDWAEYALHMQQVMAEFSEFMRIPYEGFRPQTKFERRGIGLGHEIVDLVYCKK